MRGFVALTVLAGVALSPSAAQVPDGPAADGGLLAQALAAGPGPAAGRLYADTELLLWWFKPVCAGVPILTVGDPRANRPGALGQPGTAVVVGGYPPHKFEFPMTPGGRLTVGWDRGDGAVGVRASGFLVSRASNSQHFAAAPSGYPDTYLPYLSPGNVEEALPFTVPGAVTGGSVAVGSTQVWGVGGDLSVPFAIDYGTHRVTAAFLVGGRYLDLTDQVRITNALRLVADPGAAAVGADRFSTRNQFAGPLAGTAFGVAWGRCEVGVTGTLAAGLTHQVRNVDGTPLQGYTAASPLLVPGPLQALPSNVGHARTNRVTLVPEVGLRSRVAVCDWCTLTVGYTLLYWNKVICPGDQMSPQVNVTQLPYRGPPSGPAAPQPQFVHTDYFAQGLSLGLSVPY